MSALVLPEAMPVADDDRQLPMFQNSPDPGRDLALHVVQIQAEAIRNLTGLLQLAGLLKEQAPPAETNMRRVLEQRRTQPEARKRRRHVPQNPDHRTWRGFVLSMRKLEDKARDLDLKLTKQSVCGLGPDSVKTVTRTMTETYGLPVTCWPPSRWDPEQEPSGQFF